VVVKRLRKVRRDVPERGSKWVCVVKGRESWKDVLRFIYEAIRGGTKAWRPITTQHNNRQSGKDSYTRVVPKEELHYSPNSRRWPASGGPGGSALKHADLRRYSMFPIRLSVSLAPSALFIRSSSALLCGVPASFLSWQAHGRSLCCICRFGQNALRTGRAAS
jgi:hypothetical protein